MKIMKLTDVGQDEAIVRSYINSPEWIMQQKMDGARMQAIWHPGQEPTDHWQFTNDGLKPITFAAALLVLPRLEIELSHWLQDSGNEDSRITFDGELIIESGTYHIFDVPELTPGPHSGSYESAIHYKLSQRLQVLTELSIEHFARPHITLSPTAFTSEDKAELWDAVLASGVEGAVSKHLDSLYVPGTRTKDWVKHKLVKTFDAVVLSTERTFKADGHTLQAGKASLGLYQLGTLRQITSASLIGKDLTIAKGDVVEVAYLYRERGKAPIQPRILRKRYDAASNQGDKLPRDCAEDQFVDYTRGLAWKEAL